MIKVFFILLAVLIVEVLIFTAVDAYREWRDDND